ncbi:tRNA (guanine-N(7)-)-methyltransferase [Trifolium repens]|nr:tRNA (guanine-N(7)-)-methyltransferase [Trifolium repens]
MNGFCCGWRMLPLFLTKATAKKLTTRAGTDLGFLFGLLQKYQTGTRSLQTLHCHSWWILDVVFVQSDVLEVALDMKNQFDEVDALQHIDSSNTAILCDSEGWLLSNPMGIRTEREVHAEFEGAKIYRRLYEKKPM